MYGRVVIYTYDEDKKALEDKANTPRPVTLPCWTGCRPTPR